MVTVTQLAIGAGYTFVVIAGGIIAILILTAFVVLIWRGDPC